MSPGVGNYFFMLGRVWLGERLNRPALTMPLIEIVPGQVIVGPNTGCSIKPTYRRLAQVVG